MSRPAPVDYRGPVIPPQRTRRSIWKASPLGVTAIAVLVLGVASFLGMCFAPASIVPVPRSDKFIHVLLTTPCVAGFVGMILGVFGAVRDAKRTLGIVAVILSVLLILAMKAMIVFSAVAAAMP